MTTGPLRRGGNDSTGRRQGQGVPGFGDLSHSLGKILRQTEVLEDKVTEAVSTVGARLWPGMDAEAIRVVSFRRGTLQLEMDSHARVAEARGFLSETFRTLVNEILQSEFLEQGSPSDDDRHTGPGVDDRRRPVRDTQSYVSRLNFRVKGMS